MRKVMLAVVALAVSFGAVANAQQPSKQQQWIEHRSPELGFSARFPQAPQTASQRKESKDKTHSFTQHTVSLGIKDRYFSIAIFDYGQGVLPSNPDAKYWSVRVQDFVKGSGGALVSERPITLAGQTGVEAVMTTSAGAWLLLNMLLTGNRLYGIASGGPKGHDTSADAIRFRDSFQLLGR